MILDDVYAFCPGQMIRLARPPYKNVSGCLRAEPGDNRMAVAYVTRKENDEQKACLHTENQGGV